MWVRTQEFSFLASPRDVDAADPSIDFQNPSFGAMVSTMVV
jgi:hypothetical protein